VRVVHAAATAADCPIGQMHDNKTTTFSSGVEVISGKMNSFTQQSARVERIVS